MKILNNLCDVAKKFGKIMTTSQKRWGIVVFVLSIIGAIFEMLGVSVILPLVQVMMQPEQIYSVKIVQEICQVLGVETERQLLVLITVFVVLIYVIKNVFLAFLSWVRAKYSAKIQRELSIRMLHSYVQRGYSFFRQNNSATLVRGVTGSVSGVKEVIYLFMKVLAEVLTILCIFIYIIITDWKMALSVIVLIGSCLFIIMYVFKGLMRRAGDMFHQNMALSNRWILQLFGGIKEVIVLDRKEYFVENYEKAYVKQLNGSVRQTVAAETPAYIIEGTCIAGIIMAVCIRMSAIENPASYIPQLASFAVAAFRLLPSVGRITSNFNICVFNLPAVSEVYDNIVEAELYDNKHTEMNVDTNCTVRFEEELRLEKISWKYPDGDEKILDNISLCIKKGEAVAFVGPSGAGKSTLADIILGLFIPQDGKIYMDDIDILSSAYSMAGIISFVPQSVYLIDDTVRRNIAFGINDEEINEEAINRALEQSQMKEFIDSLPNGLDTLVGERGVRFSGGQAQRLAIARALYTNPDILVLDEATSALDNETENAVMEAIEALQGKITLIIIAHRLTTVRKCDKIYEIKNGKINIKNYNELIAVES